MQVIRYAKLPVTYSVGQLQSELMTSQKEWSPHFNSRDYTGSWIVLPLRSPGGATDNIYADLMANEGFADTIYMQQFPTVKNIVAGLLCPVMAARFLNLQAGSVFLL